MKKLIMSVLVLILCGIFLSSCMDSLVRVNDKNIANENENGKTTVGDNIQIKVLSPFGETNVARESYKNALDEFEKKYGGITILDESVNPDREWTTKVVADFASGNHPDIMLYYTDRYSSMIIDKDFLVSVGEIRDKYPDYGRNIDDEVFDKLKYDDGENYAVPVKECWDGLFINTDLFREYDVPIPVDYESFVNAVEKFSTTDIVPISADLYSEPNYWIEHLILSAGTSEEYSTIPKRGDDIPQNWQVGIDAFISLYQMGAFSSDVISEKDVFAEDIFVRKEAAMRLDNSSFMGLVQYPESTSVIPFYKMDGSGQIDAVSGDFLGFFVSREAWSNREKREAIYNFIQEMTSKENMNIFLQYCEIPMTIESKPEHISLLSSSADSYPSSFDTLNPSIRSRLNKNAWLCLKNNMKFVLDGSVSKEAILNLVISLGN